MPRKFFINIWKKITFFIPAEILNLKFTPAKKMLRLGYFSKIGLARISTTFPANGQILLHRKYCVKIPDQKAINSIIEEVKKSVHKLESEIEAVKQIYSANPSLANSWLTNLQQNFSALRNGMDEQFKCLVEQLENGMDQKHRGTIEELREQMQANYDDLFEELEKRMHQKHGHLLIEEAEKRMDQKYKGLIEQLEKRMDEKQKLKGLIDQGCKLF